MKGEIRIWFIALLIAVITGVLAILLLVNITNFDALFLSNDQRILKQYTTCALAYCAAGGIGTNGQTSDEVNAVGCLKSEGGKCTLTCAQVEKEVYLKNHVQFTVQEVGGRGAYHYCGPEANLSFEFSGVSLGGTVPLASGQMDKLATSPQWVCKPIRIPFTDTDLPIPGTAGLQHSGFAGTVPQNCIILSGDKDPLFPVRGGCFQAIKYDKSYDSTYYTPLIEYDSGNQIIYPSAIYVDQKFTTTLQGSSEPECDYQNQPNHQPVSDEKVTAKVQDRVEIQKILNAQASANGRPIGSYTWQQYYDTLGPCKSADTGCQPNDAQKQLVGKLAKDYFGDVANSNGDNLIGNVLNGCKFKTTYNGKKITYKVWAKPVYPTFDALAEASGVGGFEKFIGGILKSASPQLFDALKFLKDAWSAGATLIASQLGGSCTAVVLGRDLPQSSSSNTGSADIIRDILLYTDQKTYQAGGTLKFSGQLVMASGSPAGRDVTVDFLDPALFNGIEDSVKVATDKDGKFLGEFKLSKTAGGTGFVLRASFLEKKSYSNPFNIGG